MNKDDLILARDLASQGLHRASMAHEDSRKALDELRHAVNMFDAILFDKPMVHDEPEDAKPIPDLPDLPERATGDALMTHENGNYRYAFIDHIGTVITCGRQLGHSELELVYGEAHVMHRLKELKQYTGEGLLYRTTGTAEFHFIPDEYEEDNA